MLFTKIPPMKKKKGDKVPVGKEDATTEKHVGTSRGETLNAVNEGWVKPLTAKPINELVVVDLATFLGRHFPWIHHLLLLLFFWSFLFIF